MPLMPYNERTSERYVPGVYLKCEYSKGMFPHEWALTYKPYDTNPISPYNVPVAINKEDLIPESDTVGLVKLLGIKEKGVKTYVWINNLWGHTISCLEVHTEDVIRFPENLSQRSSDRQNG